MTIVRNFIAVLLFIGIVYCMKVVPERAKVLFFDKNEFEFSKLYVSRHGRKSGYFLNLESINLKPWYNNITVHLIFYEYLHNEYRRSFVEMQFKICDFLNEAFVGGMLRNAGLACPVVGEYHLMNMTLPTENFPYVFPFEKFRVNVYINITETKTMIYMAQVYCHLKN